MVKSFLVSCLICGLIGLFLWAAGKWPEVIGGIALAGVALCAFLVLWAWIYAELFCD